MWSQLSEPWQACLQEAWTAYCHGSHPVGAVINDAAGYLLTRGRNRVFEVVGPSSPPARRGGLRRPRRAAGRRIGWRGGSTVACGLAFSGGGLLGAAHFGVLRAFDEWHLAPDVLTGASAGGLVAGAVAAGAPLPAFIDYGAEASRHPLEYLRPRLLRLAAELLPEDPFAPVDSLLDSGPFIAGLVALWPPPRRTTQWRLPTVLTAVDLAALEGVAFVGGPPAAGAGPRGRWRVVTDADLAVALGATMAMPGVFSPARGATELLVDGGVADTLPVDWAPALGASRVVAVDVAFASPGLPARAGIGWVLSRSETYATATLSRLRRPPSRS